MEKHTEQLSEQVKDALTELGNIGAGNATTSLSVLLSSKLSMSAPTVKLYDFNELENALGGPETSVVAAACASPLPARPFCKTAFNCAISSSLSSVPSSEVSMMLVRYPSNASRHLNTISTRSALTFIFPFRISENTFSISCVKRCIRLYPIVPAIPFNEWAALKISFTVSTFSGSDSNIST